jgi:hypothetical protein
LREWHQQYKARGLTLIAVHGYDYPGQSPIAEAVTQLKIDYPVAHDEQKATWKLFGIRARPAHVLIGPDGAIADRGVGLVTIDEVKTRVEALLPR